MKVRSRLLLAVLASLVAVSMIATGCGGGGGNEGKTDGESKAVTVKIGIGAPLTDGAVALGEGIVRGAKLAVKQANESQELKDLGITIETSEGDDRGKPEVGTNVAQQFASDQSMVGVVGHLNSGVSIPASTIYAQAGLVQVTPASTNPSLTIDNTVDSVFRTCTIDSVQGPFAADAAFKDLGFKNVFVVDDSTPYGTGLAAAFKGQFEANGGKSVGFEKTADNQSDFKALVTKIKGAKPDFVYYGGIYNAGALFSKQLSEGGVTVPVMGGDGLYDAEYVNLAGAEAANGDFCTSVGLPLDQLPKGQDFKAAFEAEYPGKQIAAYDAYAYDAAQVIIEGIKVAAEEVGADKLTTPEGKKAIVAAVAKLNFEGLTGPISFDENGDTNNKAITLYTVKDGAWAPYVK